MRDFIEGAAGSLFVVIFLMGQFPGGTIVMALSCNAIGTRTIRNIYAAI